MLHGQPDRLRAGRAWRRRGRVDAGRDRHRRAGTHSGIHGPQVCVTVNFEIYSVGVFLLELFVGRVQMFQKVDLVSTYIVDEEEDLMTACDNRADIWNEEVSPSFTRVAVPSMTAS